MERGGTFIKNGLQGLNCLGSGSVGSGQAHAHYAMLPSLDEPY